MLFMENSALFTAINIYQRTKYTVGDKEQGNRRKKSYFETAIPAVLHDISADRGAVQHIDVAVNLICI